jgi:hypothetical protein
VAVAADGHQQFLFTAEVHRRDDISHVNAASNQARPPIDHRVVDLASGIVTPVAGLDELSAQAGLERGNGGSIQLGVSLRLVADCWLRNSVTL